MPLDRRFAIVVGINDYSKKPLNYCANDASAVAGMLIKRCGFRAEDIHPIISDNQTPIKDITGRFDTALQAIKTEFVEEEDSLFFFFAGHGGYFNDQSMMSFQDSQVWGCVSSWTKNYGKTTNRENGLRLKAQKAQLAGSNLLSVARNGWSLYPPLD